MAFGKMEERRLRVFENEVLRGLCAVAHPGPGVRSRENGTAILALYSVPKASLRFYFQYTVGIESP